MLLATHFKSCRQHARLLCPVSALGDASPAVESALLTTGSPRRWLRRVSQQLKVSERHRVIIQFPATARRHEYPSSKQRETQMPQNSSVQLDWQ